MSLLKTSTLNGFGMAVKLFTALLVNKVIALLAGPNGIAVYGQFQSLMTLINGLAASPAQAGVIRLTAANQDDLDKVHLYWAAALRAVLLSSLLFVVVGVLLAPLLAEYVLKQANLVLPLTIFFLTIPAASLSILLLSCANGISAIRSYVIAGILIAIIVNMAAIVGVYVSGLGGAIIGVALGQVLALIVLLRYLQTQSWFSLRYYFGRISPVQVQEIFALAAMAFVAVMIAPLIQIVIRQIMTDMFGLTIVGYWQAVSRFGEMYVMVVTALLGVYYFPRFSAVADVKALRQELQKFLLFIYPLFLLGYVVIVLYKEFFITVMYSQAFLPAAELMPLQMVSDAMRILSWLTGYLVMARSSPKLFVSVEIGVGVLWVALAYLLMMDYGYKGALYASILSNFIYSGIFVVSLIKSKLI